MRSTIKKSLAGLAALGALGVGGAAVANAASDDPRSHDSRSGERPNRTQLTGETATKVRAAALAKVSGGTVRGTHAEGTGYEAHVTKADGTHVEVHVDREFKVTSVQERQGRGRGSDGNGRGHHRGDGRGGPRGDERALTGETATKVRAAALARVSGGTVLRVETDSDGAVYEAHMRKADGTEVEVKLDREFKVTSVEEHGGPR